MARISVLGSGAWGTAIGNHIAKNGHEVKVWSIVPEEIEEINNWHTNSKYLPGAKLSSNFVAHGELEGVLESPEIVFVVLPSHVIDKVFDKVAELKGRDYSMYFVVCTKGMDQNNLRFMSQLITDDLPNSKIAILSGPNFAKEVVVGTPSVTTIATKDKIFYEKVASILNCEYFKTYYSDDPIAAQVCGFMKNVIAISCGICEGLEWGRNTQVALILQGLREIGDICEVLDGDREILLQPAGVGDLILTSTSRNSRNMSFGFKIGQGKKVSEIIKEGKTVEGAKNANCVVRLAKKYKLTLPLCEVIHDIVEKDYSVDEIKKMLLEVIC